MGRKLLLFLGILWGSVLWAQNPRITSKEIIFTYKNPEAREVKILFSMDNYRTVYFMEKVDESRWELRLSLADPDFQLEPGTYSYRLIVDGITIRDPNNPYYKTDPFVGKVSYFEIRDKLMAFSWSPQKIGPLTYRFYFRNNADWQQVKEIMFAGTFNRWQPYEYFLRRYSENLWYLDFHFNEPGTYYYQYGINGNWVRDPANPEIVYNKLGEVYSVVRVEE